MSFTNCRRDAAKLKIVADYDLKPVVYIRLLNGQKINGCCGPIKDKYYLFEAKHRVSGTIESFCVGYDCGRQFLQLINHPPLELFNPFLGEPRRQRGGGGANEQQRQNKPIAPLNKELKNAIHILCSAWTGKAPEGRFRAFLDYIYNNPARPTNSFAIDVFNNAVGKDAKGRTLTKIIEDLRRSNPNLRHFEFPLMQQVLRELNCESNL